MSKLDQGKCRLRLEQCNMYLQTNQLLIRCVVTGSEFCDPEERASFRPSPECVSPAAVAHLELTEGTQR
ncbi:unnamed protein product [Hermetia illucens]|uniref:Uncharacterized protein n=1 Tax=Hermetia illucens TaxID=343691 RepID=A0A7R8V2Q2_HERIL|nr:unnamed protein product [Hermetia illucens]